MASYNCFYQGALTSSGDENLFFFDEKSPLDDTKELLCYAQKHINILTDALKSNVWSKGHWTIVENLKYNAVRILRGMLTIDRNDELNSKLLVLINSVRTVCELVENKKAFDGVFSPLARNFIAGYNFQTLQVPESILASGAWDGDAFIAEYLIVSEYTAKSMEEFVMDRSERLLKKGHYLVRPQISRINDQSKKINFYAMENRSISTGTIQKKYFSYSQITGKFSADGKLFDSFEAYRVSVIWEGYRPLNF